VLAAGRVDILVNNAATVEPLAFEVNGVAPAALSGAVLPGMLAVGWSRIVNVSSWSGRWAAGRGRAR
jgi:NAD(P)-dependent dehydrogenase (short-subunit alcohol dehydrogenase family)